MENINSYKTQINKWEYAELRYSLTGGIVVQFYGSKDQQHGRGVIDGNKIDEFINILIQMKNDLKNS
ncbi:MAG TPA: hypothetical protein DC000_03445 [Clostridiales bacterium]|nr:hypothetical protein [Clostridiales bacterium]